jgi:hypothetical protein
MAMRLVIHCPYCKRPVPTSPLQLGRTITCVTCRGEFVATPAQMREDLSLNPTPQPAVAAAVAQPVSTSTTIGPRVLETSDRLPPSGSVDSALVLAIAATPSSMFTAAVSAASSGATARFITDTIQPPSIAPAADGTLPTLQLADSSHSESPESPARPVPLWVAFLLLTASTALSTLVLLSDSESHAVQRAKADARQELVRFYGNAHAPLLPYQLHLREAQLSRSRQDWQEERAHYREVLALLRAEGRNPNVGLTGTPREDEYLGRLLSIVLSDE